MADQKQKMVEINIDKDVWKRCFTVHSLVVIGSKQEDGAYNFAPKHMAMPLGISNHFGFMGTPRKTTYRNIKREGEFTVSYPKPSQLMITSLTASRREEDDSKPILETIPTVEAELIDGRFLEDSYLQIECVLKECLGKFGEWELVAGEIVAARVQEDVERKIGNGMDEGEIIHENPILGYLHPDRYSIINQSHVFPYPEEFKR